MKTTANKATPSCLVKHDNGCESFLRGLVFGFDIGTGSIGWAVRQGSKFLDVGVLICPEDTTQLDGRRSLRRQRRTLRSRKYRRQWFARELALLLGLKLLQRDEETLALPETAWQLKDNEGYVTKRGFESLLDPVALRVQAVEGRTLCAEELFTALTHLFRRRGYADVPWKEGEAGKGDADHSKEVGEIKAKMSHLAEEMKAEHCSLPCQLLAKRKKDGRPQRKEVWPRELLETEFRAVVAAQSDRFPSLAERADWLLYGDTQEIKGHHVYFANTGPRNSGVLGLRWPRFENRGPALDAFAPVDERGHPLHVVRKNKKAFGLAQWELAIINFRVIDVATGARTQPDAKSLARLREMWESSHRKQRTKTESAAVKVTESMLKKWAAEFSSRYRLIEGQQSLTPQTGAGRARFSSPTLHRLREIIATGQRPVGAQPVLRRAGETSEAALNRYLADIKHPLVRHRLMLFRRLLANQVKRFGPPDLIVLEAVRSLAMSNKAKADHLKRVDEFRKRRETAREQLRSAGESASRKAIIRYRLWEEAGGRCPFCLQTIERTELAHSADIEHLVPRSRVDCNELFNLTVAHLRCNRELKGDRTPYEAFHNTDRWDAIKHNAETCFKGQSLRRKLEIFLSDKAEELIERRADLQHTAYIARVIRHVTLLQLGWLGEDGRDPTPEKQNPALRFQVTNGQLTGRLRQAWGLNQLLHPLPQGVHFHELPDDQQKQFQEKNRGDLRHHALDAMVISCTWPWLAHRTHGATDEFGNHGWWTQDEKQRSKAANPVFPGEGHMRKVAEAEIAKVLVQHHVSRSPHRSAYATTIYGKKAPHTYVAREVFTSLTPRNLGRIWPEQFAAYCEAAWRCYADEAADLSAELKLTRGCVPHSFARRLCFAHFQKWRTAEVPEFHWPDQVKIPIRSVKLISVKDDAAVMRCAPGTPGYVKRSGFKEVRIHVAQDGMSFVPVLVPFWRGDKALAEKPYLSRLEPVAVIRKGQVVTLKQPLSAGAPVGRYRILVLGQSQVTILPPHVANKDEAKVAFGLPKSGYKPYWPEFIRCLGYELPHSPSAKPSPTGPGEAGPTTH